MFPSRGSVPNVATGRVMDSEDGKRTFESATGPSSSINSNTGNKGNSSNNISRGGMQVKRPLTLSTTESLINEHSSMTYADSIMKGSQKTQQAPQGQQQQQEKATADAAAKRVTKKITNVKRIFIFRHGESTANVDMEEFVKTPDWKIPLTPLGVEQSKAAGRYLKEIVKDELVFFYVSPYLRSSHTMRYMVYPDYDEQQAELKRREQEENEKIINPRGLIGIKTGSGATEGGLDLSDDIGGNSSGVTNGSPIGQGSNVRTAIRESTKKKLKPQFNLDGVQEDPRLRDEDFGHLGDYSSFLQCLQDRKEYGRFFYRFPNGESGADVCDRVTSFLDAFQRQQDMFLPETNVVIVTHGMTANMLVHRWFHLTVDHFEAMNTIPNGKAIRLDRVENIPNYFMLDGQSLKWLNVPPSLHSRNGYALRNKAILGSISLGAPYL